MNCPNGHGPMQERLLGEYEAAPLFGLRSVIVKNLTASVCSQCETMVMPGDVLDRLHESLLLMVLTGGHVLSGEDVRFIRKALRLSQSEFGDRLGVHRTTVTRWETGEVPIDPPVSIAIRALALVPKLESLTVPQRKLVEASFEKAPVIDKKHAYELRAA